MVKMIMHGCNGAMGQVISKIVEEEMTPYRIPIRYFPLWRRVLWRRM